MTVMWTRRAFWSALGLPLLAEKSPPLPVDWVRYQDAATEFEVLRLTNPEYASTLAGPGADIFNRRSNAIVFGSTRAGKPQAFRLELSNGQSRQLSAAADLDPESVGFVPDDRGVTWWDGPRLMLAPGAALKEVELARVRDGYTRVGPASFSDDSTLAFWIEERNGRAEILRWHMPKGPAEVALEADAGVVEVLPNPRRAMLFWRTRSGELWVAAHDGSLKRRIETPPGRVAQACWSPGGSGLIYLLIPEEQGRLNAVREQDLESRSDKLVAPTSQFGEFARNANATVFLGASLSKASPFLLLLLRATRRELTLCEHRSPDGHNVNPRFSPDSQRIVFQSSRSGKPALYMMKVDRLVEKTET
jgi:dipeptidyl aminopeptidase/acylaminoacyl peptidase